MSTKASNEKKTTNATEICWLQPRPLTQEEISRLARAQSYAVRITEESKQMKQLADTARSIDVNNKEEGNEFITPEGWPLTLGGHGLVLRLGELEASALRLGECYLCVRSAAASATAALATTAHQANANAADTLERNTVEIALVWRASSMRAPGILGWDREDEFMDWRETNTASQKLPPTTNSSAASGHSSSSSGSSGESSSSWRNEHHHHHHRNHRRQLDREEDYKPRYRAHHESRSTERHNYNGTRFQAAAELLLGGHDVVKSKSSSSVDAWAEEARAASERRSTSSGRCNDWDTEARGRSTHATSETRNKLKRGTRVVSPATMEKWKETTRCETRSRVLAPRELANPVTLESVASFDHQRFKDRQLNGDHRFESISRPDEVSDLELPAYINTLLVTVERKIERVSIDDLTFPCTACRNIDTDDPLLGCKCAGDTCECENEATCECNTDNKVEVRSFEVAGIKHIDSDDEEEVRMGFGTKKRIDDVTAPRTIHEISERVLNCGVTLPGYTDIAGRPVLEFDGTSTRRDVVSSREMASLILYLARLPSVDSTKDGFTLFISANSKEDLETLDRALTLLKGKVKILQAYFLRTSPEGRTTDLFPRSHLKTIIVEENTLEKHIPRRTTDYNHELCIAYYKEYDSVMTEWQAAGRRLALEMSELKECSSLSGSLAPLNRLLTDPTLRRTAADAEEAMATLEDRAAPVNHIDHVGLSLERARRLVEEVGNAATRLESSFESRRATIRNLSVLRSIEDQAREVLSWLCKKGEDILSKHGQHAASNITTARLHEREFEKFYFTSMEINNFVEEDYPGCRSLVRQALQIKDTPEKSMEIMLSSLTESSTKQYDSALKNWWYYCVKNNKSPFSNNIPDILEFLTETFDKGVSYGSVNAYRSAISLLVGSEIAEDSRLKRFFKGVSKLRPPKPKYDVTWDPKIVLDYFNSLGTSDSLSIKDLSFKLITLLALITGHRIQTFSLINIDNIERSNGDIKIKIPDKIKTSGINRKQPILILPFYSINEKICVASILECYLEKTKDNRGSEKCLFIALKAPYKKVTSQTLSRWVKQSLESSGINVNIFSAHSTRHASTSAAKRNNVDIDTIRKTVGWTPSSNTFTKFYNLPLATENNVFANAILNC